MKKIIHFIVCLCISTFAYAQNDVSISVKDEETKEPVDGAFISIKNTKKVYTTNKKGIAEIAGLANGKHTLIISHTGYAEQTLEIILPYNASTEIFLSKEEEELEEVIVQTTRTSRSIQNTPTRVETIDAEEIDEKSNMRPGNVVMLLHESTGMQVQQTSATSGNASIRVQGLDGRYTQLLKDGYPNFGNFAGGLSLLEIPPLDLKQVEVIKGPSSTLYGAGAIAGVINFISKQPGDKGEYNFIFNQSNIGQTNLGGYASKKYKKIGYSILALYNHQKVYDVDKDDFSELPHAVNFTVHPRLFFYPSASATIMLGNSFSNGENFGGDLHVIRNKPTANHVYFEKNKTTRNTTTLEFDQLFKNSNNLKFKQSLSFFDRSISTPGYLFSGISTNSFTDLSYVLHKKKHVLVSGLSFIYDKFRTKQSAVNINQQSSTAGIYIQDTWDIIERVKLESGIRVDHVWYSNINYKKEGTFFLPRVSALFKISDKITSRISGGLGYKTPTIFTEETETMQYKNLLPLYNVEPEKSTGVTADINYRTKFSPALAFSLNQLFFYTRINKPLVLVANSSGYSFMNAAKPVTSKGFETNMKFIYRDLVKLFVGYTYTDARASYISNEPFLKLIPRHKLNLALLCEKESNFKIGLEGYLTGEQYLSNNTKTPSYWELGFMAEKTFRKISVFINFENFTDERQSKYKRVVNGPPDSPSFDEIWNHTEGFVMNGGIKIKL